MGNGNPYRDAAAELWPERTASPIAASLDVALRQDPERRAEAERLGRALGVPAEVAEREPDEARRQARLRQLDPLRLYRQAPKTAEALEDPSFAAVAHDDVEALSALETFWGGLGAKFTRGVAQQRAGELRFRQRTQGALSSLEDGELATADEALAAPEPERTAPTVVPYEAFEVIGQMAATLPSAFRRGLQGALVTGAAAATGGLVTGPGAVLTGAAGAGLGFGAGFSAGLAEAFARSSAGSVSAELREQGASGTAADLAGSVVGLSEGALELVGARIWGAPFARAAKAFFTERAAEGLKRLTLAGAAKGYAAHVGRSIAGELPTELAQEAVNVAAEAMVAEIEGLGKVKQGLTPFALAERFAEITVKTVAASVGLGAAGGLTDLAADVGRVRQSRAEVAALEEAAGLADAAKTKKRLPEAFKQWARTLATGGPLDAVYLDPDRVGEILEQGGLGGEDLFQALPALREEWAEHELTGRPVRIPIEDYLTHVAGTPLGEALRPHLRGSENGLSAADLQALGAEMAAEHSAAVEATEDLREPTARDRLTADLAKRLGATGRYRPEDAQAQAEFHARIIDTMARRAGQDPDAIYQELGLRIRREAPEGLRSLEVDRLDLLLDRARAAAQGAEKPLTGLGPTLTAFLRKAGGLADRGGELRGMDAQRLRPGLVSLTGQDPDAAGLAAYEAGYFDERPTPDQLLEAIRDELAGRALYTREDRERVDLDRAQITEARQAVEALGLDFATATNEQIKVALAGTSGRLAGEETYHGYTLESTNPETGAREPGDLSGDDGHPGQLPVGGVGDPVQRAGADAAGVASRRPTGPHQLDLFAAPEALPADPTTRENQVRGNFAVQVALQDVGTVRAPAKIRTAAAAARALASFANKAQENYLTLVLDAAGAPLAALRTSMGTETAALVSVVALGSALSIPGAAKVYVAHNHPSGRTDPSADDIALGKRLENVFRGTSVELAGHLILGSGGAWSEYSGGDWGVLQDAPVKPARERTIPVQEREVVARNAPAAPITGADRARPHLSGRGTGVLLLDAAARPLGFVAITPAEMRRLRGGAEGALDRLLRAVGESNANAAIIQYEAGDTQGRMNLGNALQGSPSAAGRTNLGLRVLDAISTTGRSMADEGMPLADGSEFFQGKPDAPRGSIQFLADEILVTLGRAADLSTFHHEAAHLYLRMWRDLSRLETAPPEFVADGQRVLAWLGAADWDSLTREQEEQFARGFEAYLFEGKAPAPELQGAFRRFAAWMVQVYRRLEKLRVDLTPEIREVYDRMVAADDELRAAEERGRWRVSDGLKAGMTEAEAAAYVATAQRAHDEAVDVATRAALREVTAARKAARADAKKVLAEEVSAQLRRRPVYRALAWLSRGEWPADTAKPEGLTHVRLDRDTLARDWGPEVLDRLRARAVPGVYGPNGAHPEFVARLFGYPSAEALVTDLMSAAPFRSAVNQEVNRRLAEEHPDPMEDAGERAELALDAVHGDARGQLLGGEVRALYKRVNGPKARAPAAADIAKLAAGRILREKSVSEALRLKSYHQAELRAARAAEAAIAAGDWAEALAQKQRQLLNHYLVRASLDATREVKRAEKRLAGYRKAAVRAKRDQVALRHVLGVLERLGYQTGLDPAQYAEGLGSLVKWAEDLEAETGVSVALSDFVANEANRVADWRTLPLADFLGAMDSLASIESAGKRKNKLFVSMGGGLVDQGAALLAAKIRQLKPRGDSENVTPSRLDDFKETLGELVAEATRLEFVFRRLDGGELAGLVHGALFQPIADAQDARGRRQAEVTRDLLALLQAHYTRKEMADWKAKRPLAAFSGKRASKADLLAMALNWGNEENRLALARGFVTRYGWELEDAHARIEAALKGLDARDAAFVQGVWDLIDQFWPEVQALELEVSGVAPKKVEASPAVIGGVTLRGGYYPLKYDTRHSQKHARYEAVKTDKLLENIYAKAQTSHGHTKARVGSGGAPVLLDLGVIATHLTEVIHDLTHRKAVIDIARLTAHHEVEAAIVETLGGPVYQQLRPWLQAVASERFDSALGWESILDRARIGVTVATLGWRVSTVLTQLTAVLPAMHELGAGPVLAAVRRLTLAPPKTILARGRFAYEHSQELRWRAQSFDREVRDAFKRLDPSQERKQRLTHAFFLPIAALDGFAATAVWSAAYEGAIKAGRGHPAAVQVADQVVRQTQSAGSTKDLAAIQRKPGAWKLFTMYYSYFSVLFNQFADEAHKVGQKGLRAQAPELLSATIFLAALPALLGELLVGRGPDEDDDEGWAEWAAKTVATYPLMTVPLLRDVLGGFGYRYQGSPAGQAGQALVALGQDLLELPETGIDRGLVKDVVTGVGYWYGLPTGQAWTTLSAFWDWLDGQDVSATEFLFRRQRR